MSLRQRLGLPPDASVADVQRVWLTAHRRLGLKPGATIDEVRAGFRRRARALHPDCNPDDDAADRFRLATEARDILLSPELRAEYVAIVTTPPPERTRAPPPERTRRRGDDITHTVSIDFLTALRGGAWSTEVDLGQQGWRRIEVQLRQGTETGLLVRVPGEGAAGEPPGDLWLIVEVEPHPTLRVDGLDLVGVLPVSFGAVYEGRSLVVETPWERVQVRLKPGVFGRVRIPGHGIRRGDNRGALVLALEVTWPPLGDAELIAVLRRLQPIDGGARRL